MKKTVTIVFALFCITSTSKAQNNPNEKPNIVSENVYTPLKPANASAYIFATQEQYNQKTDSKKNAILSQIKSNIDNPEKVKVLRENLWRLENATIRTEEKK
jgi:hypothetical protein